MISVITGKINAVPISHQYRTRNLFILKEIPI